MEKKTPLYSLHEKLGGKIVPFGGYLLPIQYSGIIAEHHAVREKAGIFDVSHMGEIYLKGKDALKNIQRLVTNDCESLAVGRARYSPMCNENGGVIDDLLIYRLEESDYLLVVNAANREKDAAWIESKLEGEVEYRDISDEVSQIALQGPDSNRMIEKLVQNDKIPQKYYSFTNGVELFGHEVLLSRTGYTGEDGFEIYCKNSDAVSIFEGLLEHGKEYGVIPCGLGARDTLRAEAAMPLYGHEMTEEVTPIEAGLSMFVKLSKEDFIGKDAIVKKGEPKEKRYGLKINGRGIAREGCLVFLDDRQIGKVTTGTMAPALGYPIAMAMLLDGSVEIGGEVTIDVRGKRIPAEVVALPFYKRSK